jgi:hypothetical protein
LQCYRGPRQLGEARRARVALRTIRNWARGLVRRAGARRRGQFAARVGAATCHDADGVNDRRCVRGLHAVGVSTSGKSREDFFVELMPRKITVSTGLANGALPQNIPLPRLTISSGSMIGAASHPTQRTSGNGTSWDAQLLAESPSPIATIRLPQSDSPRTGWHY